MRESELGLEVFLTDGVPGIGGKLRKTPDDFKVDEISIRPPESPDGRFVIAEVWHRNWEANRLVRRLASNLHLGRNRIGFAGTKDGRSVATQLMSFNAPLEDVNALTIPDVEIRNAYLAKRMISIGDLIGNRFEIKVSDVDGTTDVREVCQIVTRKVEDTGGFPNFFGVQRFGSVRPITHLIGKDLTNGDFEGAVMRYVGNPSDEDSEINEMRRRLQETRDFEWAISEFPMKLTFERMMIGHLKDHPEDYLGALRRLPSNLLMMFVHAYQSLLFNKILSERLRRGISIRDPVVGDLVLPLDKSGVPDQDNPIPVTADNLEKVRKNAIARKAFVSCLVYGTDSAFADGEMGEIERHVIEEEGVSREDFQIVGLREASSKGVRREMLALCKELKVEHAEDDSVMFKFDLNKGCYATCLLREYMKTTIDRY